MDESTPEIAEKIIDTGIETGADRLTSEKIERVISRVIKGETGARLKVYVNTCAHCGLCSDACHHYLSRDKNPLLSPAGKVKQTMLEILKNKGRVNIDFIKRASEISYTECNLCRRCIMYCPFGIDIAYIIQVIRRICHLLGVTPQYIQDTSHSHAATLNQMWINEDEWIDTLLWQEEEAQDEIPHLRIPLDKEGADVFYSVIAPEPKFQAQLIYQAAVIMNVAGVDWTMAAGPGWDNSDMSMYTGDLEITGRLKKVHYEAAMRLKTKKIVMGECGHAFRSVYDVGNRWLAWHTPPIPVVHIIEFYYQLFMQNRIKILNKFDKPVTLHDPCNIARGRGLHEMARYVVNATCSEFIEMHPNREHNYCCNSGGGVINCGSPFKKKRLENSRIKADQLLETIQKGAKVVITPCHNCHSGIEDIIEHYKLDLEIKFLSDIIYECIEKSG